MPCPSSSLATRLGSATAPHPRAQLDRGGEGGDARLFDEHDDDDDDDFGWSGGRKQGLGVVLLAANRWPDVSAPTKDPSAGADAPSGERDRPSPVVLTSPKGGILGARRRRGDAEPETGGTRTAEGGGERRSVAKVGRLGKGRPCSAEDRGRGNRFVTRYLEERLGVAGT